MSTISTLWTLPTLLVMHASFVLLVTSATSVANNPSNHVDSIYHPSSTNVLSTNSATGATIPFSSQSDLTADRISSTSILSPATTATQAAADTTTATTTAPTTTTSTTAATSATTSTTTATYSTTPTTTATTAVAAADATTTANYSTTPTTTTTTITPTVSLLTTTPDVYVRSKTLMIKKSMFNFVMIVMFTVGILCCFITLSGGYLLFRYLNRPVHKFYVPWNPYLVHQSTTYNNELILKRLYGSLVPPSRKYLAVPASSSLITESDLTSLDSVAPAPLSQQTVESQPPPLPRQEFSSCFLPRTQNPALQLAISLSRHNLSSILSRKDSCQKSRKSQKMHDMTVRWQNVPLLTRTNISYHQDIPEMQLPVTPSNRSWLRRVPQTQFKGSSNESHKVSSSRAGAKRKRNHLQTAVGTSPNLLFPRSRHPLSSPTKVNVPRDKSRKIQFI